MREKEQKRLREKKRELRGREKERLRKKRD